MGKTALNERMRLNEAKRTEIKKREEGIKEDAINEVYTGVKKDGKIEAVGNKNDIWDMADLQSLDNPEKKKKTKNPKS